MANTFIISDTHWSHRAATEMFKRADGAPLRPFASVEECDETMVDNWNRVVKPADKVYHLGDVILPKNKKDAHIMHRLNGTKVLIKGNHDMESVDFYKQFFKDVRGSHMLDNLVMTHIPVHPGSLDRWRGNIHGHLHSYAVIAPAYIDSKGKIMYDESREDPRYFCASVERINFTPIAFDVVNKIFKDRGV
jgi:calcineurin-like phosphoesterase family protein